MPKVIDFGEVEKILKEVESTFKKHNINFDERRLIVMFLQDRILEEQQKINSEKVINKMPFGGIVKNIMKGMNEDK